MPCLQVATLGKSGVSVGYYDTEEAAARAYDRAAIGLLGFDSSAIMLNFAKQDYQGMHMASLAGKSREEVKLQLRHERSKVMCFYTCMCFDCLNGYAGGHVTRGVKFHMQHECLAGRQTT